MVILRVLLSLGLRLDFEYSVGLIEGQGFSKKGPGVSGEAHFCEESSLLESLFISGVIP